MYLLHFLILAAAIIATEACTQCPHPGTFVGFVSIYPKPNPNRCEIKITSRTIAVSIPAKFYDPPDESPCGGTVNITNTCTGKTISALVVGNVTNVDNNILLTTAGLAALAPDANPNHAPGTVIWTFNG